jgi:hypothetical protein
VETQRYVTTGQLPGLSADNAREYLTELGFVAELDSECIRLGRVLNEAIQDLPVFVEAVVRDGSRVVLSVACSESRELVCSERVFVVILDCEHLVAWSVAVRDAGLSSAFLERVRSLGVKSIIE